MFYFKCSNPDSRYLAAAVVLSTNTRKKKTLERDLVKVIEQEEYAYQDPVTEFILWSVVCFLTSV